MLSAKFLALCLSLLPLSGAFLPPSPVATVRPGRAAAASATRMQLRGEGGSNGRRDALRFMASAGVLISGAGAAGADTCSRKDCQPKANYLPDGEAVEKKDMVPMQALNGRPGKSTTKYPDYTSTESGLQYKDAKVGTGESPVDGDRVVIDWEGYTIGYYGRIFQAKNKVQGGAFAEDPGYYRFVIGTGVVVPGLEEGLRGMKPGGVRQIVVPPGPLSYPSDDSGHKRVGPRPSTFGGMRALNFVLETELTVRARRVGPRPSTFDGMRALNFVLENQGLIDKTLLFNVKLIRVDKPGPDGGFTRQI